jgi:hypothetical protein
MNKKLLILLSFVIITITAIIVAVIFYTNKNKDKDDNKDDNKDDDKDYINRSEIVDYFNLLDYDSDGAPKGGFLISMISSVSLCKNYNWVNSTENMTTKENFDNTAILREQAMKSYRSSSKKDCLMSASECQKILNVADIDDWLTTIISGGTNCYNLATTYWRKDFPKYVFGPYKGNDMVIGVLLDVTKIFDYIAGLYPMDSGTVARYNNACSGNIIDGSNAFTDCCNCEDSNAPNQACYPTIIESNWITSDKNMKKQKWRKWLSTKDSTVLGMAGIGKINDNYNSGLYDFTSADQWIIVTQSDADQQLSIIRNLRPEAIEADSLTRKGTEFTVTNNNRPFDKYNWATWAEAVKILYNNAEQDRLDYLYSQYLGFDGYRENEVDLIVPNKKRSCEKSETPCEATDEFKKVFINSIMGIISLAEDNCSNTKLNQEQGPGGVGCVDGTDNCMSDPGKRTPLKDSSLLDPVNCLANAENCFDANYDKAWCTKSNKVEGSKCCCSTDFTEDLVKKLVDEFNNSEIRIKAGAKKIHGYRVRCESMYSFSDKKGDLDIVQIT